MNYDELRTWAYELEAENLRLKADNKRLREGGCRFNCRNQKEAFTDGFLLGCQYSCGGPGPDHVEKVYAEWKARR